MFIQSHVAWIKYPQHHGLVICPRYEYGPTATFSSASAWSRSTRWRAYAEEKCEVFYSRAGKIHYAGTYLCHSGPCALQLDDLGPLATDVSPSSRPSVWCPGSAHCGTTSLLSLLSPRRRAPRTIVPLSRKSLGRSKSYTTMACCLLTSSASSASDSTRPSSTTCRCGIITLSLTGRPGPLLPRRCHRPPSYLCLNRSIDPRSPLRPLLPLFLTLSTLPRQSQRDLLAPTCL